MHPLFIVLLIICIIIGIILLFDFSVLFWLLRLKKEIKNKLHCINILMAQKYDLIIVLAKYLEDQGIVLPKNIQLSLDLNSEYNFKSITTTERLSIKTILTRTVEQMYFIADTKGLVNDERYLTLKKSIGEIDTQSRKSVALYNSDVCGFNYWICFPLLRPISMLFNFKKGELLY